MQETVFIEQTDAIAHIVLNRPSKRNALSREMWRALERCVVEVADNPDIKVVVVRGVDDTAFAAGADISEFETIYDTDESRGDYRKTLRHAQYTLAKMNKPTLARIQGPCVGAGCGIALCCDIRIADPTASFGITPARLGIAYALWDTKRLVDTVGPAIAKHILFTGSISPASEAHRWGLVDHLVASDEIVEWTDQYALSICRNSRYSTYASKTFIEMIMDGATDDGELSQSIQHGSFVGEDFIEGRRAFVEKRKPNFTFKI